MYTRQLDEKDFKDFYTLAYKALIERNDIGTDFDQAHFTVIIKNILVNRQHITIGLFDQDIMCGFAILMIERMPYNNDLIGVFSVESEEVNIFDKSDELIIKILQVL